MILPLLKGLGVTLKHFLNPFTTITVQYPEEKVDISPRFRGLHEHLRDKDDNEKCVACGLCAKACPSNCITIDGIEDDNGVRKAARYEIEMLRCIFCGYCEEACPVGAIHLSTKYDLAALTLEDHFYDKERLMAPKRAKVKSLENEDIDNNSINNI